jgi:hypothetical protein
MGCMEGGVYQGASGAEQVSRGFFERGRVRPWRPGKLRVRARTKGRPAVGKGGKSRA